MDVRLPRLGEGADSGTVVNIFVKEDDAIKAEQPIVELESEKAVASIPSPAAGKVTKIHVKTGDKIAVGALILSLTESATTTAAPAPKPAEQPAARPTEPQPARQPAVAFVQSAFGPSASPTIRRMARELGIDLARVAGRERGGRIVLADLHAYIQRLQEGTVQPPAAAPAQPARPVAESLDFSKWGPVRKEKASVLRKTIARRMVESWTTIPHVTQFDEADITSILDLRKKYVPAYEKKSAHLTLTPFILRALAATLRKHPILNASYDEAAGEIVFKDYCHVGIAVDTEHGLIVPVLRDVDKKSMLALSIELAQLADKAKARKLTGDDMKGGTFTISNQGGIGGAHFTPIINKPEVAILGIGRGAVKAIVKDKQIVPRTMLPLALSYDHRVIDGANAARFIVDLVQAIEQFTEDQVRI
ncbi:MAG: branched-chain alpha-keto acid dehydrogenase subunit E2 [Verrucomicrobiae bacterium]|nr:branched-chain alpha-keto acid dehydrogenase subunit E2 [Verrucomicrobiae bacterium]